MEKYIEQTIKALEKNNMQCMYVEKKSDVLNAVKELLPKGATVAVGGSVTLDECGVIDLLRNGDYVFYDRYAPGLTVEQTNDVFEKSLSADAFLMSSNAITQNGELYNVDGRSNRVAPLVFGPKSVIIVVGKNKIVENINDAVLRVKTISAPLNAKRLNCNTYCAKFGKCVSLNNPNSEMSSGCGSDARICCNYVVSAKQRVKNRIKVIICGEDAGY